MLRVGTIAVDSTKLAANASVHENRTFDGLREEAQRIIEAAIETDRREDELYGEKRGDELPQELADPRTRKARIRELLEQARAERDQVEAERAALHERQAQREQTPRGQRKAGRPPVARPSSRQQTVLAKRYNVTDPDSGIVRHRGMMMQGYNVHAAVADGQVIIATQISGISPDGGQLEPMVCAADQALARVGGAEAGLVLADTGYWDAAQIARLKARGRRVLIPPAKRKRGKDASPEVARMHAELTDADGHRDYQRRQQIIEPVFAHCKHIRQITRVWRRGKTAVQAEIDLIATTHNLLKLYRAPAAA
jgi:hypothetical protein